MPLRVPEVGGPIDPDNEAHDLIMSVSGGVSKGKRNRIKIRVPAMAVQAQLEGRFLGGRPPNGYKLIDAGPHPNPAKAAGGKRLHALAIDELPAEVVGRITFGDLQGERVSQKAAMGALPVLRAATDPGVAGGQYYGPGGLFGARGYPKLARSSGQSHDTAIQRRLWTVSEELTGVTFPV